MLRKNDLSEFSFLPGLNEALYFLQHLVQTVCGGVNLTGRSIVAVCNWLARKYESGIFVYFVIAELRPWHGYGVKEAERD